MSSIFTPEMLAEMLARYKEVVAAYKEERDLPPDARPRLSCALEQIGVGRVGMAGVIVGLAEELSRLQAREGVLRRREDALRRAERERDEARAETAYYRAEMARLKAPLTRRDLRHPVCKDCPIGGRTSGGPVCPNARDCDHNCQVELEMLDIEGWTTAETPAEELEEEGAIGLEEEEEEEEVMGTPPPMDQAFPTLTPGPGWRAFAVTSDPPMVWWRLRRRLRG